VSATDRPFRRLDKRLAAALLVGLPVLAFGQSALVTDADIARVQREQPVVTEADIERARQRYTPPAHADPAPAPHPLNVEALPVPRVGDALNLGAVAEGFRHSVPAPSLGTEDGPALVVFVSLSMPEPALRRLIAQAAQARAPVVIRGLLNGSLRQTAARLQALIGQGPGSVQIDPRPFEQYGIQQVPAFVLTRAPMSTCSESACTRADTFVRTSGDVSLDYALAYVQRTAPAWAPMAATYLHRLER